MSPQERIAELEAVIAAQCARITELEAQIALLQARLGMNSRNSSKPPSSDGYAKPAPKSRRTRSGRKPGKQPGAPGHHLARQENPDVTKTHVPDTCRGCSGALGDAPVTGAQRRQVFDLPPVALLCTEHVAETRRCRCGTETTAPFPREATAPACYGPALRAYVCYLVTRQHIPIGRVAELLRSAYGATVSTGEIAAMVKEGAAMLEEFLASIRQQLTQAGVVHADESGLRVEASTKWVHSASTAELTLYHLDDKRGLAAMQAMGVYEHLAGILVHDGWAPFRGYANVAHALCNAHHVRELQGVVDTTGQTWASEMMTLLTGTWDKVVEARAQGRTSLGTDVLDEIRARYDTIIASGYLANPEPVPTGKRGRPKRTKAGDLVHRLDAYREDVLRFAADFSVGFDNNQVERDIRMVKVAQKVSGGFRSRAGAEAFLAFRSYLSTAMKQGVNLFDALIALFEADPWMPASTGQGP